MLTVDLKHFPLQSGEHVLDLGCGEGRHVNSFYLLAPVVSVGVDLNFRDVGIAQQRMQTWMAEQQTKKHADDDQSVSQRPLSLPQIVHMVANGQQLPFAANTFDKVICSEVLEHIHDYAKVLDEIYRVLKPGGMLCVSVPRYWPEKICWMLSREYHEVEGGHLRIFKAVALEQEICEKGFAFQVRHWAHALHVPYWWLKCLLWDKGDEHVLLRLYHRFLVWDLMQKPWFSQTLEKLLNPLLGKSVVMYFVKKSSSESQ